MLSKVDTFEQGGFRNSNQFNLLIYHFLHCCVSMQLYIKEEKIL